MFEAHLLPCSRQNAILHSESDFIFVGALQQIVYFPNSLPIFSYTPVFGCFVVLVGNIFPTGNVSQVT